MRLPSPRPYPNRIPLAGLEPSLKGAIGFSIALHALLFVVFAVRAAFGPAEIPEFENSIRVDIVGLPDKVAKLPPAPAPQPVESTAPETKKETLPEAQKATSSEPHAINLNKTKHDQAAALKRLQALEKLRKMAKTDTKAPGSPSDKGAPESNSALVKGNAVNAGSSLTGLAKVDNENYRATIKDQVTRRWNLPHWLSNASLSAIVKLFIDERGALLKKELVQPSANAVFDESVMRAIEAAVPFPRPPSGLVDQIAVWGISIEFKPSEN